MGKRLCYEPQINTFILALFTDIPNAAITLISASKYFVMWTEAKIYSDCPFSQLKLFLFRSLNGCVKTFTQGESKPPLPQAEVCPEAGRSQSCKRGQFSDLQA